jgi:hypothetical protein
VVLPLSAACAQGETFYGAGGSGRGGGTPVGTGGSGGSQSGAGGHSSGTAPTSCAQAGGYAGCCLGNTSYYCQTGSTTVTMKACPSGQVCGWNASKSYYSCVAPPGGADPSNMYPIACQ